MLKYKCLQCGIEWGDSRANDQEISHGWCPQCIRERYTEKIHRSQLKAGFSDCFNRGFNDCGEENCCFRVACQDYLVHVWQNQVIETTLAADMCR